MPKCLNAKTQGTQAYRQNTKKRRDAKTCSTHTANQVGSLSSMRRNSARPCESTYYGYGTIM